MPIAVGVHAAAISGGVPAAPGGVPGELAPDEKMLPTPLSLAIDDGDLCGAPTGETSGASGVNASAAMPFDSELAAVAVGRAAQSEEPLGALIPFRSSRSWPLIEVGWQPLPTLLVPVTAAPKPAATVVGGSPPMGVDPRPLR